MRTSMRWGILTLLLCLWPQLGCHQLPAGKSVQELRPIQPKDGAIVKQELSAQDIAKSLVEQAKAPEDGQKHAEAVALYEKIRTSDPAQGWHATKRLALIYLSHNELDKAEQEYQRLWQANPNDLDAVCSLGDISYRRGHFGIAQKRFQDVLARKPDHSQALINLGMTLALEEKYQASFETFKKVLSEPEAHCQIAWVMNRQGKHDEALRSYQLALQLKPDMERARTEIAGVFQARQTATVRLTTPTKAERRGIVDLEPAGGLIASDPVGRMMTQRPTLPPLAEFDAVEPGGMEWQTSTKKK